MHTTSNLTPQAQLDPDLLLTRRIGLALRLSNRLITFHSRPVAGLLHVELLDPDLEIFKRLLGQLVAAKQIKHALLLDSDVGPPNRRMQVVPMAVTVRQIKLQLDGTAAALAGAVVSLDIIEVVAERDCW